MLKKSKLFVVLLLLLHLSFPSKAQKETEKYVVFIFEDTRYYSEYGKTTHQSEVYYWISSVESLLNDGVLYPLYLPFQKEGSVSVHNDTVYLSSLTNENGMMKINGPIKNHHSYSFTLINWLDRNKKKKQSVKIKHALFSKHSIRRKTEEINIYFVPVLGKFCEGILRVDDNKNIRSYYAIEGERIEKANLDEKEKRAISFFDCSLVDFSAFITPYSVYHKGHSLLKSAEKSNQEP